MIWLLLLACVPKAPPVAFPTGLPDPAPPDLVPFEAAEDECAKAAPFIPGRAPPFLDDGLAVCRAQVVPESQIVQLVQDADAAAYWRPVALACYERSEADRLHAQNMVNSLHYDREAHRQDAQSLRIAAPAVFVGGVIVGAGVGIAAAKVSAL